MLDQAAIDVLRNQPVAEQGHFVNGAFAASREGATLEVLSPIDGKPLTRIASGTAADVGLAVEGARKAFEDGRWSIDMDRFEAAVTPRTRALFINTPSNPTGWVATKDDLKAILAIARKAPPTA